GGAELARLHAPAAQLAVGAEERTFVLGRAAHEEAELPLRTLLDLARSQRLRLQGVRILSLAGERGRRRDAGAGCHVEGDRDGDQGPDEGQPALELPELHFAAPFSVAWGRKTRTPPWPRHRRGRRLKSSGPPLPL